MVPTTKEELRKLVTETTVEMYEELTPQLMRLSTMIILPKLRSRMRSVCICWDIQKRAPMRLSLKCFHRF